MVMLKGSAGTREIRECRLLDGYAIQVGPEGRDTIIGPDVVSLTHEAAIAHRHKLQPPAGASPEEIAEFYEWTTMHFATSAPTDASQRCDTETALKIAKAAVARLEAQLAGKGK